MKDQLEFKAKPTQYKCGLFYFVLFAFFLLLSLTFQGPNSFYELGAYKNYLVSIIQDHDFNIINQVQPPANWLITENYFHPDFHSESYTGFLFLFHLVEKILTFGIALPSAYRFHLGFAVFNFFCLFFGFKFVSDAIKKIGIYVTPSTSLIFYFSTALFYYSVFWANVTDILIFLLISYLIKKIIEYKLSAFDLCIASACIGYLTILRPMNVFMLIPFLYVSWKDEKRIQMISSLIIPFLLLLGTDAYLKYLKFSKPISQYYISNSYITDFSISDITRSFFWGFFGPIGVFTINISYFIGIVGLLYLSRKIKKMDSFFWIGATGLILFISYSIMMLSFLGPVVEDQLPGRFFINIAPFIFIGFAAIFERLGKTKSNLMGAMLIIVHIGFFFQYYLINFNDYYQYPNEHFLSSETFLTYFTQVKEFVVYNIEQNFSQVYILVLSLGLISLISYFLRKLKLEKAFQFIVTAATILYFSMSIVHAINYERNISSMKSSGFFEQSSVALGAEALGVDYLLDAAATISRSSDRVTQDRLKLNLKPYFAVLRTQIQTHDPKIVQLINEESFALSFLVRMEQSRKLELTTGDNQFEK